MGALIMDACTQIRMRNKGDSREHVEQSNGLFVLYHFRGLEQYQRPRLRERT